MVSLYLAFVYIEFEWLYASVSNNVTHCLQFLWIYRLSGFALIYKQISLGHVNNSASQLYRSTFPIIIIIFLSKIALTRVQTLGLSIDRWATKIFLCRICHELAIFRYSCTVTYMHVFACHFMFLQLFPPCEPASLQNAPAEGRGKRMGKICIVCYDALCFWLWACTENERTIFLFESFFAAATKYFVSSVLFMVSFRGIFVYHIVCMLTIFARVLFGSMYVRSDCIDR